MKEFLIAILLIVSIPTFSFAEDVSVDELLGNQENSQNVEDLEQERTEEIENELKISVPDYTDNPSHIITFVDPSEEKLGVEIDIDESGYKEINSPYSLPSLSIGEHHLKFRFVDSIGATKILEYDIVIIPRPPIIRAPQFNEQTLLISGTGLANSEIVLILSVNADNYTQKAEIDKDGDWETSITLDSVATGIYTIFGYTRKDGYASNPSEPAVFEYGSSGIVNTNTEKTNIYFNLNGISLNDIPGIISQNPDILIVTISFLLFGALIASLLFIITRNIQKKSEEDFVSEKMKNSPKKERTLLELFGEESKTEVTKSTNGKKMKKKTPKDKKRKEKKHKKFKKEKKVEAKEKKEEHEKKEKVFTRHDFLKDFKNFDPDKDTGKENKEPTKKEKKDVVVTLTSPKKEE
jgi:hypothetical protein